MKSERRIPPLPEELVRGAEQLRATDAPEGFDARLRQALADADRSQPLARPSVPWTRWLVVIPSLAAMAIALHVAISPRTQEDVGRLQEHHVQLAGGEPTFVDLDVWVHDHEDDSTLVQVDTPSGVSLQVGDPSRDLAPTSCDAERCQHRFVHPDDDRIPLRVGIAEPGRYHIHVEHRSTVRRVRDHFVVHAN
ncbi:MAG: hypothetical protein IT378_25780 [Sandaracinaceae bacterium]|nr:hypothetical protein [Sandaracinaceae bacterium]